MQSTVTLSKDDIVLTHDVEGSLNLGKPEFSDAYQPQIVRIHRKSRGLKTQVFRDNNWLKNCLYTYIFRNIPRQLRDDFQGFIKATRGDVITFTPLLKDDGEDDYIGYVSSVDPIVEEIDGCSYQLSFTIQRIQW